MCDGKNPVLMKSHAIKTANVNKNLCQMQLEYIIGSSSNGHHHHQCAHTTRTICLFICFSCICAFDNLPVVHTIDTRTRVYKFSYFFELYRIFLHSNSSENKRNFFR